MNKKNYGQKGIDSYFIDWIEILNGKPIEYKCLSSSKHE